MTPDENGTLLSHNDNDDHLPMKCPASDVENGRRSSKLADLCAAKTAKTVDDFLTLGPYMGFLCVLSEMFILMQLGNMMFMIYAGAAPTVLGCGDEAPRNLSQKAICSELVTLRNATGCQPLLKYDFLSTNVEFDYLCTEGKAIKNSISLQMVGVLFGALVCGQISDSFGRKFTLLGCVIGNGVFGALSAFSGSLSMFTLWRTIGGFFNGGQIIVMHVFVMEQMPKRHRFWVSAVFTYSPNFIILAGLAYLAQTWRNLAVLVALLAFPALALILVACESPRWLLQMGRIDEARRSLVWMRGFLTGRRETKADSEDIEVMLAAEAERQKGVAAREKHYVYHLFCTWTLAKYSAILAFGMFVSGACNYGLLFNMEKLSGSIYLNSAFFGIIRWTLNIGVGMSDFFIKSAGRKMLHFCAGSFLAVSLSFVFALHALELLPEFELVARYTTLAATAMCSQMFIAKMIVLMELYPTAIRNIASSFVSTFTRFGSIIAPQIFYLADIWPSLPFLTMAILMALDVTNFQCVVPETKGKPMNDRMPPPEERLWGRRRQRSVPNRKTPIIRANHK